MDCEVGLAAATAEPLHPGGASSVGFFLGKMNIWGLKVIELVYKKNSPSGNPIIIHPEKTSPDCQDFSLHAPSGTGLETSKLPMEVLAPAPVTNEPMPGTSEGPRCDRGALRVSMCRTCRAGCACGTRWTKPSRLPESMCFGDDFAVG